MKALFSTVDELNACLELFHDVDRSAVDNNGPFIIVCDEFYSDPNEVRRIALSKEFFQYKPPLAKQVGSKIAAQYADSKPAWFSSSLLRYLGTKVKTPQKGYRYATPDIRMALSKVVGEEVVANTWDESGDWWNGAFHLQYDAGESDYRVIHHHYRDGDVAPVGWSGLVYLSPDAPEDYGTTIWREKNTGLCIAAKGSKFDKEHDNYELALSIGNRFNRLVLFRENVLHRASKGFGNTPENARLMQTFFFQVNR